MSKWDQSDVMMISYGDSIKKEGRPPLRELNNFMVSQLKIPLAACTFFLSTLIVQTTVSL